jgi:hypothetical protein
MFGGFIISHDPDISIHQSNMQSTGPSKYVQKDQVTNLHITFLSKKKVERCEDKFTRSFNNIRQDIKWHNAGQSKISLAPILHENCQHAQSQHSGPHNISSIGRN